VFSTQSVQQLRDATTEDLLRQMFSVLSVPRSYKDSQLPLQRSLETTVRGVGTWCEMAASLRKREPGSRGTSTDENTEY
jgi:hypothetical protein